MVRDDVVDHEIAGHSFAHTKYTDLTKAEARTDLQTLVNVAETQGYDLTSFVYPSDQIAHTELLSEFGFQVYRGGIRGSIHTYKSGFRALLRGTNQFLSCPPISPTGNENGLVRLPTSRLLRDERWWFLQPHRLKRGIASMASDQYIHLTIHPHNFLDNERLFRIFDSVLSTVASLRSQGQIEVATMDSVQTDTS
jgi:hypothetical protein